MADCPTCGGSGWIQFRGPSGPASVAPCTDCGAAQVLGEARAPELERKEKR